ncbi:hypothetical protein CDL12_08406 [Handroanthus impetiginosus]|uniref:Uncharacterized protein n=1 Tax=Handroanthus impetiginosus TaxID=429701 RepID=A0A2G9HN16_9LAMI|nr:hypothetical protein CDL12_08406 [Handroanthus impetiginosus]
MIAYELCLNNFVDTTVIYYINFIKSLITSPADFEELREKRILLTSLGSDEDVMKLIQDHYDSKGKTWKIQLFYAYFSSPLSVIA